MSAESRWFRVNCDWWESDWVCVLSAEARLAWILFLGRAKTHGVGGWLKKTPTHLLARQWMIGEESLLQVLKAAEQNGALLDDEDSWVITGWAKYQGDTSGAKRQSEFRRRKSIESNGSNALRDGVTTTETETETETSIPPTPRGGDTAGASASPRKKSKVVDHSEGVPIPLRLQAIPGFVDAWDDRRAQRLAKPSTRFATSTAAEKELASLETCLDPIMVLNRAISSGWQGLNIKSGEARATVTKTAVVMSDMEKLKQRTEFYKSELGYDDNKAESAAREALGL